MDVPGKGRGVYRLEYTNRHCVPADHIPVTKDIGISTTFYYVAILSDELGCEIASLVNLNDII